MTDLAMILIATLLGAALLAIVLLYLAHRRTRTIVTDLSARVAAQQIAALTDAGASPAAAADGAADPEQKPVRRKRHLALYLGGGSVIAALTALGRRARHAWRHHRTATIATAGTVVAAGTAAALYMTPGTPTSDPHDPPPSQHPTRLVQQEREAEPAPKPDPTDDQVIETPTQDAVHAGPEELVTETTETAEATRSATTPPPSPTPDAQKTTVQTSEPTEETPTPDEIEVVDYCAVCLTLPILRACLLWLAA